MKRRIFTPDAKLVQDFVYTQQQLPTHKPIVQYIRQSTTKQLKRNKRSYELQDPDLRRMITHGYGWPDNNEYIIKIDSDQGKSGTKRRDERGGLDCLYELLENDKAGAVAAFDVPRLYRVPSRAEYGAFCDLVLERKIPVITFHRIYWPTCVDNDQLNDDFKAAAMFIEEIIKGKLIAAKHRHIQYDASYAGMLVSREAHERIVNMDDFMYAYERLSGTTLDGEPQGRKARERRLGTDALLGGKVCCGELPVYVTRGKYEARADDELYERVEALKKEQEQHVTDYTKAIARIDVEICNAEMAQRVSKELGDEHGYRENTKQLVQLRKDRAAIEVKADGANKEVEDLGDCYNLIECARQDWNGMKTDNRKRLVRLLVLSANVSEASPHFVRLDLAFAIPINTSISLYFYRARGSRQFWTTQEDETLRATFASASKEALMQALPTHSWLSIAQRGYDKLGIRRMASRTDTLNYSDIDVMARTAVRVDRPIGVVRGIENIKAHNWEPVPEQVRVLLYELPPEHWAVGGQTKAAQKAAFSQQYNEVDE